MPASPFVRMSAGGGDQALSIETFRTSLRSRSGSMSRSGEAIVDAGDGEGAVDNGVTIVILYVDLEAM
jgi:hypothetical protein